MSTGEIEALCQWCIFFCPHSRRPTSQRSNWNCFETVISGQNLTSFKALTLVRHSYVTVLLTCWCLSITANLFLATHTAVMPADRLLSGESGGDDPPLGSSFGTCGNTMLSKGLVTAANVVISYQNILKFN